MKRKMAAIMASDIAGYSKLVAEDEEDTLRRLASYRHVFEEFVALYEGRIFNTAGDAILAEFASAVASVRCAIDVQESLRTRNLAYAPSRHMNFRIGITIGDVVEDGADLLGDGVNIAARLESLAPPGGICISRSIHEQVANKMAIVFDDIGEQQVKNIPTPVHAFQLSLSKAEGETISAPPPDISPRHQPITLAAAFMIMAALGATATLWQRKPHTSAPLAGAPPVQAALATASRARAMPQPNAPSALRLAPAVVPLVSDAMRQIIVRDYMPARDYKALAISLVRNGMATERDSEEAASAAALDACKRASDAVTWNTYTCDLFAIGEKVVSKRGLPPLPQAPWLVRDRSIETPFDINRVPWTPKGEQEKRLERYSASKQSRALAIASSGTFTFYFEQHSLDEAVRRALEACGYAAGVACRILAVDDVFVLPIPATRRAVSFFNPQASDSIAPELRDDVSRKLSNAQGGWSSVAVGSAGKIGMSVNAASETEATRSALDDCGRQDRNCRLVAIGPFAVDPM